MGSKIGMVLLSLGLGVAVFAACKPTRPPRAFQKTVASADSIVLYQIEEYPTTSAEQQTGQYYLHGYATRGRQQLSAAEMTALKAALRDPATFDTVAVKSCPMLPKMALDLRHKGKSAMSILISPAPCGKVLIFEGEQSKTIQTAELTPSNRLEALVFGERK